LQHPMKVIAAMKAEITGEEIQEDIQVNDDIPADQMTDQIGEEDVKVDNNPF